MNDLKDLKVEKVMDRKKIANAIHSILDVGIAVIKKEKLTNEDYGRIKAIRTLNSPINAAVAMIQQETAQIRSLIVLERMKQLGYSAPQLER